MTGINALLKAARHGKRADADASVRQKQRQLRCRRCMGSLPDGHAKCCQVDALARQHANAFEHAIWNCMWRIGTVGLGAAGRW
jgi:hypothetical protein